MRFWYLLGCSVSKRPQPVAFVVPLRVEIGRDLCREEGGGGEKEGLGPRNDVLTTCKAMR